MACFQHLKGFTSWKVMWYNGGDMFRCGFQNQEGGGPLEEIRALKERLEGERPVDWEGFPDIGLYMDQLIN